MATRKTPTLTWTQCEQALEEIHNPNVLDPTSIERINTWLVQHHELNEKAANEWRNYCCTPPFGCKCSNASGEYRLHQIYELLNDVKELYQKESFYKSLVEQFVHITHKQDELEKWLDKHLDLAVETNSLLGMDFWDDECSLKKESYPIKPIAISEPYLSLKADDFVNAIHFLVTYQTANRRLMYLETDCKSLYIQAALVRETDIPTIDEIATHIQSLGYDFEVLQEFSNSKTSVSYSFLLNGRSAFVEVNSSHPTVLFNEYEWIKEDVTDQDVILSMTHSGMDKDCDTVNLISIALIDKSQAFIYFLGNDTIHTRESLLAEMHD
jgi:hypothetical protein